MSTADGLPEVDPFLVPGQRVVIQLRNDTFTRPDGTVGHVGARPLELVVLDADACRDEDGEEHCSTICPSCAGSWSMDYYVELVDELPTAGGLS